MMHLTITTMELELLAKHLVFLIQMLLTTLIIVKPDFPRELQFGLIRSHAQVKKMTLLIAR